jgi:hypothetical protein
VNILFNTTLPLAKLSVAEKLGFLYDFLQNSPECLSKTQPRFVLPVMWSHPTQDIATIIHTIPYTIHHLQYRCLTTISSHLNQRRNQSAPADSHSSWSITYKSMNANPIYPVINTTPSNKINPGYSGITTPITTAIKTLGILSPDIRTIARLDYSKPQYKIPTIFEVKADLQYDIYHLYAYGKGSARVYCGIMSIPSCKTSVFMNGLFRNIKENRNLDAIEESDDEDDFQDMRLDKYVDLNKTVAIECIFNYKFKRWTPIRTVQTSDKIVHISKL